MGRDALACSAAADSFQSLMGRTFNHGQTEEQTVLFRTNFEKKIEGLSHVSSEIEEGKAGALCFFLSVGKSINNIVLLPSFPLPLREMRHIIIAERGRKEEGRGLGVSLMPC